MVVDPLGLAGFSKEIRENAASKEVKKTKKRTRTEAEKLLKAIFKPARDEKMRRKWDFVE